MEVFISVIRNLKNAHATYSFTDSEVLFFIIQIWYLVLQFCDKNIDCIVASLMQARDSTTSKKCHQWKVQNQHIVVKSFTTSSLISTAHSFDIFWRLWPTHCLITNNRLNNYWNLIIPTLTLLTWKDYVGKALSVDSVILIIKVLLFFPPT